MQIKSTNFKGHLVFRVAFFRFQVIELSRARVGLPFIYGPELRAWNLAAYKKRVAKQATDETQIKHRQVPQFESVFHLWLFLETTPKDRWLALAGLFVNRLQQGLDVFEFFLARDWNI